MCFEDERTEIVGESVVYTRTSYGLGARGIDYIEKKVGSAATTVGFPVYDSHGNMVMTLSRSGSSWADGLHRSFDVWGSVRWNSSSSSDVKQRYCANLGHVEDDESGLMYMRARYYEPWTGRFLSEDPGRDGNNWYGYALSNPITLVDKDGKFAWNASMVAFFVGLITGLITYALTADPIASLFLGAALGALDSGFGISNGLTNRLASALSQFRATIMALRSPASKAAERTHGSKAVLAAGEESGRITTELILMEAEEGLLFEGTIVTPSWLL